jgi:antitoxin (DNA-binding transcriptional repressor) of toxin-antitoxin stability system
MAEPTPREIAQHELHNDSRGIMRGVSYTVTGNGAQVARLNPLRRRTSVPRAEVLATFAAAPVVDPDRLRRDLDAAFEQEPVDREW